MEGKFPLCHELPTWHWGGERPEHQQGLWSCASLPNAARSTQKERWACFPYILMTHFSIFCSLYRIYYITSKSNIVYFLRQRVKIKRAEKEDKGKQFSCWHFLFAMPILQLCPKLTCWLRKKWKKNFNEFCHFQVKTEVTEMCEEDSSRVHIRGIQDDSLTQECTVDSTEDIGMIPLM